MKTPFEFVRPVGADIGEQVVKFVIKVYWN
jgi:hypothetical protein